MFVVCFEIDSRRARPLGIVGRAHTVGWDQRVHGSTDLDPHNTLMRGPAQTLHQVLHSVATLSAVEVMLVTGSVYV